jgi:hypothetical protein
MIRFQMSGFREKGFGESNILLFDLPCQLSPVT